MPNFVLDSSALDYPKSDLYGVPPEGDATKYLPAASWNALCQAAVDLRTSIQNQRVFNIRDYGAVGNGSTNDSAAVIAAVTAASAAGGGVVYIPRGTYVLGTVHNPNSTLISPRTRVSFVGEGPQSVLKAANGLNGAGTTFDVIAQQPGDGTSTIDDVIFRDFTVDLNGVNNLVPLGEPGKLNRAIAIRSGNNIFVERVRVENNAGQQCLAFGSNTNPQTVTNVSVSGCYFYNVGTSVAGNTHQTDHSAVYVQAINAAVTDNHFENVTASFIETAVEDHSSRSVVTGNVFKNWGRALNIISTVTDHQGSVYANNVGTGLYSAAIIWAYAGLTMSDILIAGNQFEMVDGANTAVDMNTNVQAAASPSKIRIVNNQFRCLDNTLTGFGDVISVGQVADCTVKGNDFYNALGAAVALGTLAAGQTTLLIEGNNIYNCGRSTAAAGAYHSGIRLNGVNALAVLNVERNRIGNSAANTPMTIGIDTNVPVTLGRVVDNVVENIGSGLSLGGTYTALYVRHVGSQSAAQKADAGSQWTDTTSGVGTLYVKTTSAAAGTGWAPIRPESLSSDRGDANQTLVVGTDAVVQQWKTNLTANRTVTLSTTGIKNGDKFRIVRTGLGAFTLDVGGLKTIPSATAAFVDVQVDSGGAWRLTAYGAL